MMAVSKARVRYLCFRRPTAATSSDCST
jgi:hypothetical protein